MLTEKDVDEIERGRRVTHGGPVLLKWLDQLLADRRERIQQVEHLRQRLNQAFRYLDGLCDMRRASQNRASVSRVSKCPKCGLQYARAHGVSPSGIRYIHHDGSECNA